MSMPNTYDVPYQKAWGCFEAGQFVYRDGRLAIVLAAPIGSVEDELVPIMFWDGSGERRRVPEMDLWEENAEVSQVPAT